MSMPVSDFPLWDKYIRSIFGPFTDASSRLRVMPESGTAVRVEGTRRFRQFSLLLQPVVTGHLQVISPARGELAPLSAVLCGAQFADLDALARSMIPFLKARLGEAGQVVDSVVVREGPDGEPLPASSASAAIAAALNPGTTRTRLTFLHGQAGAGKSWLLMRAALSQTHEFLTRKHPRLDLYIDAQGVNLRSLEQQIARQLDIYNGILRFPEVIPLARLGVLGLVVDGFDELITPSGSDDTLRALYRYLADFEGQGAVVASARTSFFYLRDLESARITPDALVSVGTLQVQPWVEEQWRSYCELRQQVDLIATLIGLAGGSDVNRTLLGRPFVVAEILKVAQRQDGQVPPGGLLAVIEGSFASRERLTKLVDPDALDPESRGPLPILSAEQFDGLLLAVAEEMWRLRQSTLDIDTLKTLAAMWADEWHLPREYKSILVDRIDANAFLEPAPGASAERRVQFPHEVIFSRVLARLLASTMFQDHKGLVSLLRLAPTGRTVAEQFGDIARSPSSSAPAGCDWTVPGFLRRLADTGRLLRWRADDDANARLSVASMTCELLRALEGEVAGLVFAHLHFSKVSFRGARLGHCTFRECTFEELDARASDWSNVTFVECDPIVMMKVSAGQRFHSSLPDVHHVVVDRAGTPHDVFGRTPCRRSLFGAAEMPPAKSKAGERAKEVIRVTEGLARRAQRTYWFSLEPEDSDDGLVARLKASPEWSTAISMLEQHGFIEHGVRPRAGVRARLFHVRNAGDLLEARDPDGRPSGTTSAAFWDAVERLT